MNVIAKTGALHNPFLITRIYQIQYGQRNLSCVQLTGYPKRSYPQIGNIVRRQTFASSCFLFGTFRDLDVLYSRTLSRSVAHFVIHPERLKQMVKLQACQNLCSMLQSDGYRRRIVEGMEQQKSYLTDSNVMGIPEGDIKYEHMIDCAQPTRHSYKEENPEDEDENKSEILVPPPIRRRMRTTAVSAMFRNKTQNKENVFRPAEDVRSVKQSTILPIVMEARKKSLEKKKKFRRRTTILPIILKNTFERKLRETKTRQKNKATKNRLEANAKEQTSIRKPIIEENSIESDLREGIHYDKLQESLKQFNTWTDLDRKVRNREKNVIKRITMEDEKSEKSDVMSIKQEEENQKKDIQLSTTSPIKAHKIPFVPTEDVFSLFQKVKLGSMNRILPLTDKKSYSVKSSQKAPAAYAPSLTYKIVSKEKERHKQAQKDRYNFEKLREKHCVQIKDVMKVKPDKNKKLDLTVKSAISVD